MNKAQDILRSAVPNFLSHGGGRPKPKSILKDRQHKRPPPLRLAPNPYSLNGSVIISQTTSVKSPHVHFPPSASLISTYATHSPGSYDRAAISVSPNPLEMPERGGRVYDPSTGTLNPQSPLSSSSVTTPQPGLSFVFSPTGRKEIGVDKGNIRLGYTERSPKELGKALQSYPRSPYPTAALSQKGGWDDESGDREGTAAVRPQRSSTVDGTGSKRRSFQAAATRKPVSSPLAQMTFGPPTSLTDAFWNAISLYPDQEHDARTGSPTISLDVPNFAFSTQDGNLWSPGIPSRKSARGRNHASSVEEQLSMVKSPDAVDPLASFPSFTAVLTEDARYELVSYPHSVMSPTVSQR